MVPILCPMLLSWLSHCHGLLSMCPRIPWGSHIPGHATCLIHGSPHSARPIPSYCCGSADVAVPPWTPCLFCCPQVSSSRPTGMAHCPPMLCTRSGRIPASRRRPTRSVGHTGGLAPTLAAASTSSMASSGSRVSVSALLQLPTALASAHSAWPLLLFHRHDGACPHQHICWPRCGGAWQLCTDVPVPVLYPG